MKTSIILLAVVLLVEIQALHEIQHDPIEDPELIRDGYVCRPKEFEVGPMRQGQVTVLDGHCVQVTCRSGGFVEYQGCNSPSSNGSDCWIERRNEHKTFPQCCGFWVCKI